MATENIVKFGLGDQCPLTGGPTAYICSVALTDTAYYYIDTHILSKLASILEKEKDTQKYRKLAEEIRKSFRKKIFNPETGKVENNSQTALSCTLYQGLIDNGEKEEVLPQLRKAIEKSDKHIDCGILGAKYLLHVLTELEKADLAYDIVTQTTFPGWRWWISQGATTLWETQPGDVSRNHHMFSDVSAWFYKGLAGINPDSEMPGFKHIIFKPHPIKDLKWVKAWHESMYGKI